MLTYVFISGAIEHPLKATIFRREFSNTCPSVRSWRKEKTTMPMSVTPHDGGNGVLVKGYGHISDDEYREVVFSRLSKLKQDYVGRKYCLYDYSDVESVSVQSQTINEAGTQTVAAFRNNPDVVTAVAAPSDLTFGLARMWSAWLGPMRDNARLFRDKGSAERWIREEFPGGNAA